MSRPRRKASAPAPHPKKKYTYIYAQCRPTLSLASYRGYYLPWHRSSDVGVSDCEGSACSRPQGLRLFSLVCLSLRRVASAHECFSFLVPTSFSLSPSSLVCRRRSPCREHRRGRRRRVQGALGGPDGQAHRTPLYYRKVYRHNSWRRRPRPSEFFTALSITHVFCFCCCCCCTFDVLLLDSPRSAHGSFRPPLSALGLLWVVTCVVLSVTTAPRFTSDVARLRYPTLHDNQISPPQWVTFVYEVTVYTTSQALGYLLYVYVAEGVYGCCEAAWSGICPILTANFSIVPEL